MKTTLYYFLSIILISTQILAQRNHNDRTSGITKERQNIKREIKRSPRIEKPRIKTPRPDRTKKSPNIDKPNKKRNKSKRNPISVVKIPKKKKIVIIKQYIQPVFEEIEIVKEIGKDYCGGGRFFKKYEYLIMKEPYPYFPLRFDNANIEYLFTDNELDYYNLNLSIEAKYGSFNEHFAIIVDFGGVEEKLLIFNDDEEFMEEGYTYSFSQRMKINYSGYKNLRIGYFDQVNKLFYPENFIPKKTGLLVYVEIDQKRYLKKNFTRTFIDIYNTE